MAAARSETDRELTAHQLDAFHKTFNFCMSCRQYTCPNCWNEAEARCLSCAPLLGQEVMPAPFPDLRHELLPGRGSGRHGCHEWVERARRRRRGRSGLGLDVAEDAPSSGVDVADFAARLQALMAPPAESPAETVAETVVTAKVDRRGHRGRPAETPVDEAVAADAEPLSPSPADREAPAAEPVDAAVSNPSPPTVGLSLPRPPPRATSPAEAAEIAARLAAWGAAAPRCDAADDTDAGREGRGPDRRPAPTIPRRPEPRRGARRVRTGAGRPPVAGELATPRRSPRRPGRGRCHRRRSARGRARAPPSSRCRARGRSSRPSNTRSRSRPSPPRVEAALESQPEPRPTPTRT